MLRRRARGQAVVEFGLLALLFTLLLFGIVDFGMTLNGWLSVSSAAREAGRRAAVGTSTAAVVDTAREFPPPGVDKKTIKITIAYCNAGTCDYFCDGEDPTYGAGAQPIGGGAGATCKAKSTQPTAYKPDSRVSVTVTADRFQVVTPLVRPFFGCGGTQPTCFVPLNSSTAMRYEGVGLI